MHFIIQQVFSHIFFRSFGVCYCSTLSNESLMINWRSRAYRCHAQSFLYDHTHVQSMRKHVGHVLDQTHICSTMVLPYIHPLSCDLQFAISFLLIVCFVKVSRMVEKTGSPKHCTSKAILNRKRSALACSRPPLKRIRFH